MIKSWTEDAWDDYLWLQENDRKALRRVNQLLRDVERDPFSGIGKPEPLVGNLSGMWSRRIDQRHRLVYEVSGNTITVYSVRNHYRNR